MIAYAKREEGCWGPDNARRVPSALASLHQIHAYISVVQHKTPIAMFVDVFQLSSLTCRARTRLSQFCCQCAAPTADLMPVDCTGLQQTKSAGGNDSVKKPPLRLLSSEGAGTSKSRISHTSMNAAASPSTSAGWCVCAPACAWCVCGDGGGGNKCMHTHIHCLFLNLCRREG